MWMGALNEAGYGMMAVGSRGNSPERAHRVSWLIHHGRLDKCILHKCDNPRCVNPRHLFNGDRLANAADRQLKHRLHGQAKLSWETVNNIRALGKSGWARIQLSRRFLVSVSTIRRVILQENWKI